LKGKWRPVGSRYIIANGVLSSDSIVRYIQSKNSGFLTSDKIQTIVTTYIIEARKEGVNHDIAIAQMCEGTKFLTDSNRLNTYNYGDLHNITRPKEKAAFRSMELGIRVHIQQLKYMIHCFCQRRKRVADHSLHRHLWSVTCF
jgi:hypothetical protein